MQLLTNIEHRTLHFKKPAGTSRGVYLTHDVWYVRISSVEHPERFGIGECAPLPDLSCDAGPEYAKALQSACKELEKNSKGYDFATSSGKPAPEFNLEALRPYPSILFGLETALRHWQQGSDILWNSPFTRSEKGIPINGLIWMGPIQEMETRIREKLKEGFTCIKLKIGALDFEEEWKLLHRIRQQFSPEILTLRVDANGAFSPGEAAEKLKRLSDLGLHSIEQPIRAGQWEALGNLIQSTPLHIALDEELTGVHSPEEKNRLLETLKPHYIVLKPTLHGGISGCTEWIRLAEEHNIGWWITSALESNIGLNAIAQWFGTLKNPLHQGLGTGMLYIDNVDSPLQIEGDRLWYRP
jgi:L-alanine-DL-glutamate epimerase-like enolase superfamily enzyme